ncbi:MAG: hypothetical protein ACR2MX_16675, partial [Cyclobacteriaceae bacterium]
MKSSIIKSLAMSFVLLFSLSHAEAQFFGKKGNKKSNGKSGSLGEIPQVQLGLKGGVNLNHLEVSQSYSVITPVDLGSLLTNQKVYDKPYSNLGTQIGLIGAFAINNKMVINAEPSFMTLKFGYQNEYSWSQGEDSFVNTKYDFDHA